MTKKRDYFFLIFRYRSLCFVVFQNNLIVKENFLINNVIRFNIMAVDSN